MCKTSDCDCLGFFHAPLIWVIRYAYVKPCAAPAITVCANVSGVVWAAHRLSQELQVHRWRLRCGFVCMNIPCGRTRTIT